MLRLAGKNILVLLILFILYFFWYNLGNILLRNIITVPYDDLYLYYYSIKDSWVFALMYPCFGYLVYIIIEKLWKKKLSKVNDWIVSTFCFLFSIIIIALAGASHIDIFMPYVIKNIIILAICGFATPALQRMVGLKPKS